MRLPKVLRTKLNQMIDCELHRTWVESGRVDRLRAYKQVRKEFLEQPYYASFYEYIVERIFDDWCKQQVYNRVYTAKDSYVPKAVDNGSPAILESSTRQRRFGLVMGAGGKLEPRPTPNLSDAQHAEIIDRRDLQIGQLKKVKAWHQAVKEVGERHNLSENIVQELFEIESSEETIDAHYSSLERGQAEPNGGPS